MVDPETGTVTADANRGLPRQSELPRLPDGWCWKRFDAVCERVSVGHVGPTTEFFCDNDGVPLIRSQDVRPGRLMLDSAAHITPEFHAKLRKSQLKAGDVLIVRVGANRSDSCVVPKDAPPSLNCANIVFARPHEPNGFFGFFFRSPFGRSLLLSATTGAAQGVINTHSVAAMPVPVPPLSVQRRIAGILAAYDDLIENNQRRIKILEEMARSIYREWFVNFRFPGHEKVAFVDSPLGKIPEGWEVKRLKDVCHLTMGQSPKSEFYNETGEGQPFHQGVTDFGQRFPNLRLFCTATGRIAEAGDILFSVRAPVGRMNIADKKIIIGRGLSALRHKDGYQALLWEQLRNRFTEDDMMGNGAIFAAVTKHDMEGIELICPPSPLVAAASMHFDPIHSEVGSLTKQIENLRRTRDLLLPRLLSGSIPLNDVPAEANATEAVASQTAEAHA